MNIYLKYANRYINTNAYIYIYILGSLSIEILKDIYVCYLKEAHRLIHENTSLYIYMCVCVCVCV